MSPSQKYNWDSVGFDFGNWDETKIWDLNLPVVEVDMKELLWHFEAPWWANDNKERWTVTPWDVIHQTPNSRSEQKIVNKVELSYPIEILKHKGKWLILDGIHRLTKAYIQGYKKMKVHIIPQERLPEILTNDPIELPE